MSVHLPRPKGIADVRWMADAACKKMNTNLFFPPMGWSGSRPSALSPSAQAQTQAAKAVCSGCPVIDDCLAYAMNLDIEDGILGGLDPRERYNLRRKRRRAS